MYKLYQSGIIVLQCYKGGYILTFQMKVKLRGFDTLNIGETLDLPDIAELFRSPMMFNADIEDAYKYGDDFVRHLIDKTPITHKRKYIYVSAKLQYLTPERSPIPNVDWHCDPGVINPYWSDAITHIMATGSKNLSSLTEFFDKPVDIHLPQNVHQMNHREFREWITPIVPSLGITPVAIPVDKMVTFMPQHIHRAIYPTKPEFRYFWRVMETDIYSPDSFDGKAMMPKGSQIWKIFDNGIQTKESVRLHDDAIVIFDK